MLIQRWDDARQQEAVKATLAAGEQALASRIRQFQFYDIRHKAASGIADVGQASLLLGHTEGDITERVYRRVGHWQNRPNKESTEALPKQIIPKGVPTGRFSSPQKRKKP